MIHQLRKEQVEGARRYNVLDYGINSTSNDNTARLNDLIQKVYEKGGGEIYFPAGIYKFGGTIVLKSNITLNGDGWNTILLQTGTGNLIQIGDESKPAGVWFENIKVSNLFLNCDNPNNSGRGIILYGTTDNPNDALRYTTRKIIFQNLRIENFGYAGIDVDWVVLNVFYNTIWARKNGRFGIKVGVDCDVINCFIGENGIKYPNDFYNCGILVAGSDTRISNCHIWGWGQERGILLDWSSDIQILGCVIEEHSREGVFIYNSSTTRIVNNYFEDNSFGNPDLFSAIKIVGNSDTNPSIYTYIFGNRFGKQIWGGDLANHKYCVEEEIGGNGWVDYTVFEGNYCWNGYRSDIVKFVGSNSITRNNYVDNEYYIVSRFTEQNADGIWGLKYKIDVLNNKFVYYHRKLWNEYNLGYWDFADVSNLKYVSNVDIYFQKLNAKINLNILDGNNPVLRWFNWGVIGFEMNTNYYKFTNNGELSTNFDIFKLYNPNALIKLRSRPSTRASESNVLIMSSSGRAGLQVARDMRGNPYRGHAFEFATIYDDPYPTGGQTATGLRFMVGHSVDDDTADVYPLVRLYAVRNDAQYRSELAEGTGILLFQLNTTGQTDWDGGHIATKFVMYPTGYLGVNTDSPVTHLDVNGDFALKHVKVMYYSSSNNRLDIGDVSGSGSPQMIRLKGVTEIGQMFKLSNSSFSDFTGISYTSHVHGTDVLNGIGVYGNDSTLRILFPTQVNMQNPHPNSILFIQGDSNGENRIFMDNDTGFIAIVGGWSSTRNASIGVFGNDNTSFSGGINLTLGANSNASLRVYKADGYGGFSELVRVTSLGSVGIKTTNITHTLTVNGDFTAYIKQGAIARPFLAETSYSFDYGDPLRFKLPYKVEYYNFNDNQWYNWNPSDVKNLFDGRGDTEFAIPSSDYRKFRIYISNLEWTGLRAIIIACAYTIYRVKVTIEASSDGSFTNPVVLLPETTATTEDAYVIFYFNDVIRGNSYLRITFEITSSSYPSSMFQLIGVTGRVGAQGMGLESRLPFIWDFDRNIGIKTPSFPETALDVAGTIQARRLQNATSSNQFINSNLIQLQGAYWNGSQSVNVAWKLRTTVTSTISNRLDILNNSNEAIGTFRDNGFYTKQIFSWNEKVNKYLGVITNWTDLSGRTIEDGDLVVFYDSVLNTYSLYIYVNQTVGWKLVNVLQ